MPYNFNFAGSRWWKCDFHTHTPASEDYGKGSNQKENRKITPKEWLLKYMEAEIDCVAITDHNSGKWVDKLKTAYSELESENNPKFRPIIIFPGVEISAENGVHILAILPENKGSSDISTLLGAVHFRANQGSCEICTDDPPKDIILEITKAGGIAIPAHVDDFCGIFKVLKGPTLDQILDIGEITAMEIIDRSYSKPEQYKSKKLNWSEVLGSDSHHSANQEGSSDGKYPGSHFTWIKMTKPTLEGLRLALLDGNDLSIKRSDEYFENPNKFEHFIIESIIVENARYMGNGESFKCKFSPWLNTIIGGRGIGKSTIIEFIRLCLQRVGDIQGPTKCDFEKYYNTRKLATDGLIKENTKIEVYVRKDRIRFKITWDMENRNGRIYQESEPEKWIETEGDIKQRFPVSLFGQKEIFELSKDKMALLRIIDESPEVDFKSWEKENNKFKAQFLSICEQIRGKDSDIKEESALRGELQDINNKIKIIEESDHISKLKQYEDAQKKIKVVKEWKESWINSKEIMSHAYAQINVEELDQSLFEGDSEFLELMENTNTQIQKIKDNVKRITEEIESSINKWDADYRNSKLQNQISSAISDYKKLMRKLEEERIYDLNNYRELIEDRNTIHGKLIAIGKAYSEREELTKKGEKCLKCVDQHRKEITKRRKELLKVVLSKNKQISIEVIPYGNIGGIESSLRKIIGKDTGFGSDFDELVKLVKESTPDYLKGVNKLRTRILKISQGKLKAKDKRFAEYLSKLNREKIESLWCYYPEDALDVKYYDENKKRYVPIKEGSPGQKTAALLAFLMTYGNDPLILDQPEDDLDNKLIYNLIVSQIKSVKKSRQIIIVTHNANIVVNGDSENVIPFVSKSAQTSIKGHGGLQEKEVRQEVCEILEGGEKAFNMRYKRVNV